MAYRVSGKQVHDSRIIAAMNVHRITRLLTFNPDDFRRYPVTTLVDPTSIR